ncbi:IS30 family transposase [Mycoplasmopsis ciconiae]|uniref:IS30 family transposase n=1 Tax=Mycoplasmopsis ciconiae TaxID=561067 RepID=A0ABU7MLP5_9BACT|nr:IS30 family transposase [Mycoplasmopsis ciconiae]
MLSNVKYYKNVYVCVEVEEKIDNGYNRKTQVTKNRHYSIKNSQINQEHSRLVKEINSLKMQSTHNFEIKDLSYLFELLKSQKSLSAIKKQINWSMKTIKKNIEKASSFNDYSINFKCANCNKYMTKVTDLSFDNWLYNKKETIEKTKEVLEEKVKNKWKTFEYFLRWYQSQYRKYRYVSNIKNIENWKYNRRTSAQRLIDDFQEWLDNEKIEYKFENIPTIQGLYYYIDHICNQPPYEIFLVKHKYGKSEKAFKSENKRVKNQSKRLKYAQNISQRPEYINDKSEFGHYEFDTVVMNKKETNIFVTLYERKSKLGFAMISKRDANSVSETLKKLIKKYKLNIKSLTMDNGSENAFLYKVDSKIKFYVCDPYSSWQKGGIENYHKEIRKFIPKGKAPKWVNNQNISVLVDTINNTKRWYKTDDLNQLIRLTPTDFFNKYNTLH